MDKPLDGCVDVRLTTFSEDDHDMGRGRERDGEPMISDGMPAVRLTYRDSNSTEAVYVALMDVDAVVAFLRSEEQEECPLSSVRLRSISSGFLQTCPVCGENTSTDACVMVRQWLLPSPPLSIDKTALVHDECRGMLATSLEDVWEHADKGIAASL